MLYFGYYSRLGQNYKNDIFSLRNRRGKRNFTEKWQKRLTI